MKMQYIFIQFCHYTVSLDELVSALHKSSFRHSKEKAFRRNEECNVNERKRENAGSWSLLKQPGDCVRVISWDRVTHD